MMNLVRQISPLEEQGEVSAHGLSSWAQLF